ncbi:MAG: zinc-binding dehydrogenase [Acidimicrobiales bacterium]
MRRARLVSSCVVEIDEVAEPELLPGSLLVDVIRCAIGGPDVEAYQGGRLPSPAWFGHEWVGRVAAVGDGVIGHFVGERVVGSTCPPCGACRPCLAGLGDHCNVVLDMIVGTDALSSDHGAFSERIRVDARRVRAVPEGIDDREATLTEPAAVAAHAVARSGQRLGDLVVIIGGGTVGSIALQLAVLAGAARVLIIDPDIHRRELACDLGADAAFPDESGAQTWLETQGHGLGADVVYDCSGDAESLIVALNTARRGGTIVAVGVANTSSELTTRQLIADEITVRASLGYTVADGNRVLDLMAQDRLAVADLFDPVEIGLDELGPTLQRLSERLVGRRSDPRRSASWILSCDGRIVRAPPTLPASSIGRTE